MSLRAIFMLIVLLSGFDFSFQSNKTMKKISSKNGKNNNRIIEEIDTSETNIFSSMSSLSNKFQQLNVFNTHGFQYFHGFGKFGGISVDAVRPPPPPKTKPPKHLKQDDETSETKEESDSNSDSSSSNSNSNKKKPKKSSKNARSSRSSTKKGRHSGRRGPPSAILIDPKGVTTQLGALPNNGLSFPIQSTCIPTVKTLELINTSPTDDLTIYSIKSSAEEFHPVTSKTNSGSENNSNSVKKSSNKKKKETSLDMSEQPILRPRPENPAKWTIDMEDPSIRKTSHHVHRITVIFLPRIPGELNATLTIETSVGGFVISLFGKAIANPYRLHPFVGARVPIGVPYNPPIRVTNPTGQPIHIKEVFTTESFLHLSLPDGSENDNNDGQHSEKSSGVVPLNGEENDEEAAERQKAMWIVPSMATKEIIRLSFTSHRPGTYKGYVHIKTNVDSLVLPVSVQGKNINILLYLLLCYVIYFIG